ncbi:uncharacterized protein METZ01_LOCUS247006 [marine metagenome]|uniref:Uncharacterized protein n=1 Tax=marine metagenome TaxID=408172 RepID=A0A382I4A4_9ZZZZ
MVVFERGVHRRTGVRGLVWEEE